MKIWQATHVGKVRKNNEDALKVVDDSAFIVADGMGGAAAGEIASSMLVDITANFLEAVPKPWREEILTKAIKKSNAAIIRAAAQNPNYKGMGTTATILHIYDGRAHFAHIGDSRLYLLRKNNFAQLTEDHSYVEELVRRGELTPEEARNHPLKNLLTQVVGVIEDIEVDAASFPVETGDIFLLCTDGLTNMIDDEQIAEILTSENPADELISVALDNGGFDNVSAIVVEI